MMQSLRFDGIWILATKAMMEDDQRIVTRIVPTPKWLVIAAGRFVGE
jgi:hypothetical protein